MSLIGVIAGAARRRAGVASTLTNDLVGWWLDPAKLSASGTTRWEDSGPNAHHLAVNGDTPTVLSTGGPSSDYAIEYPSGLANTSRLFKTGIAALDFDRTTTARTMLMWIRTGGTESRGISRVGGINVWPWAGGNRIDLQVAGNQMFNSPMVDSTWYVLGWTFSPAATWSSEDQVRWVRNTDLTAKTTDGTPTTNTEGDVQIGATTNSNRIYMPGRYGVKAVWNRVLTNDEIAEFYNSGTPLTAASIGL